jgi:hypothetical protein
MAHASRTSPAVVSQGMLQPGVFWAAQFLESFLRAQRLQPDTFEAQCAIVRRTQAQATAATGELWDQWIARWGGGVPMDVHDLQRPPLGGEPARPLVRRRAASCPAPVASQCEHRYRRPVILQIFRRGRLARSPVLQKPRSADARRSASAPSHSRRAERSGHARRPRAGARSAARLPGRSRSSGY